SPSRLERRASLSAVRNEMCTPSMRLIYSSEVVPPSLRVAVEPTAQAGAALLAQLLAPHGLRAAHVRGGVYAVVRAPQGTAPPSPTAPAAPVPIEEVVVASSRYRLADDT